jgi:hypothetical protein
MVNIAKNQFFFIGFKNTTDYISSLQVVHNGIIINELFQHHPSVCGVYISYWELYVQKIKFEFDGKINFDDLIVFENMYEYSSSILGKLESKLKVSPDILVWYCADPKESLLHGVEALPLRESSVPIGTRTLPAPTQGDGTYSLHRLLIVL